jgi:hypothetical protein
MTVAVVQKSWPTLDDLRVPSAASALNERRPWLAPFGLQPRLANVSRRLLLARRMRKSLLGKDFRHPAPFLMDCRMADSRAGFVETGIELSFFYREVGASDVRRFSPAILELPLRAWACNV